MDGLDRQLLAAVCRRPRAEITDIAAETEMVATTAQKRLRALESSGVIGGYTARLDYEALGYLTAIVRLEVGIDAIEDVTARLRERPEFLTVYETDGSTDIFAVGKFADDETLNACLRELLEDPDVYGVVVDRVETIVEGRSPAIDIEELAVEDV